MSASVFIVIATISPLVMGVSEFDENTVIKGFPWEMEMRVDTWKAAGLCKALNEFDYDCEHEDETPACQAALARNRPCYPPVMPFQKE